jgi:thioredoxin-like negative regulator of GroEL
MTDKPVERNQHRGMAAQKATLRLLLAEVAANDRALRATQDELETRPIAAPASGWKEVADKVRYLLSALAATPTGQDRQEDIDQSRS